MKNEDILEIFETEGILADFRESVMENYDDNCDRSFDHDCGTETQIISEDQWFDENKDYATDWLLVEHPSHWLARIVNFWTDGKGNINWESVEATASFYSHDSSNSKEMEVAA